MLPANSPVAGSIKVCQQAHRIAMLGHQSSMATYSQIQRVTHEIGGFTPETCWIAHVKQQMGMHVRRAWNRKDAGRCVKPCAR